MAKTTDIETLRKAAADAYEAYAQAVAKVDEAEAAAEGAAEAAPTPEVDPAS